jgi:hypothetical protein
MTYQSVQNEIHSSLLTVPAQSSQTERSAPYVVYSASDGAGVTVTASIQQCTEHLFAIAHVVPHRCGEFEQVCFGYSFVPPIDAFVDPQQSLFAVSLLSVLVTGQRIHLGGIPVAPRATA